MKKFHFLILISIMLCVLLAFALVGCNTGNSLAAPTGLKIEGATLTLSWKETADTAYYVINISGNGKNENKNARKNTFSLSNLGLPAGDYEVKVKSCTNSKDYKDSAWSKSIKFTQDADTGLAFRFINNNTEVEVTGLGRAEGNVTIPDTFRGMPVTSIGERAFSGKSKLTGIVMSNNITSIGARAFYNCAFIKTAVLSSNLISIGDQAFQSCKLLEGVIKIPQNVTYLGDRAFAYCENITGVELNGALESIGEYAFASCLALEEVVLPNSVITIKQSAFDSCKSLTSVQFGSGLEEIDKYAFASCNSLESLNFNVGLKSIGDYAFSNCEALSSVIISNTVENLGEGAFYKDAQLSSVTLGSGIRRIGFGAFLDTAIWNSSQEFVYLGNWFLGCKDREDAQKNLSKITIEDGTIGIANYALSSFENLTRVDLPNSVKIIGDAAFAYSKINIVVIGSGVEEIGAHAFDYCDTLQYAILGEYDASEGKITKSSLMVIGEYAFANCERLENIDIPSTVEKINTYAFHNSALYKNAGNGVAYAGNWIVGCDNTKARGTIKIEEGTVGIANYAFFKCSNITAVEIPDSVKTIGRSAFYQCENLTTVTLPSALKSIEDYTFYGCTNLSMLTLPVTLEYIGRSAFYKCALRNPEGDTASDTLVIPNSVQTIGDYAFYASGYVEYENFQIRIGGIDVVVIGNAVKTIGNNAFYATPTLKKVVLGNSVQSIGSRAFYKCELLSEVVFNDSLQHIGERAFFGCSSLKSVSLPYGLTSVDDYSFYKCEGLEVVTLGANTQRIGDYAFYGCKNLKTLNLPVSLKFIGKQAFRACTRLTSIVLGSNITSISEHAFYGCKQLTIYAEDAKAQDGWNERFNSSYRPVVWGCTVQNGYVYSVTKSAGNVRIPNSNDSLSEPQRDGYVFLGWSTTEGSDVAEYTAQGLKDISDGTKVYSVWKLNDNSGQ